MQIMVTSGLPSGDDASREKIAHFRGGPVPKILHFFL
jgi:hypothetical protein